MDSPVKKLHPLLRLAVISGVETAVKLHIRRGDDLNARDSGGATPLILAASRRKKGVVRLLLDAGANPTLVDSDGMDALSHARARGCPEMIALLTEALDRATASRAKTSEVTPVEFSEPIIESVTEAAHEIPAEPSIPPMAEPEHLSAALSGVEPLDELSCEARPTPAPVTGATESSPLAVEKGGEPKVLTLDDDPLDASFADDWEAEEESIAPVGDETVVEAARQLHETLGRHKAVDADEDWGDVELHLPARAAPLEREEGDGAVRALLLAALREGMVSEDDLAEVCSNADRTRNEEAERLLAVVMGELGGTVVEWAGAERPFRGEPSIEEERLLTEATEFAGELASGRNDPFRFYSRDIRGELLEAEEEIALGREMEEAGRDALAALAKWPKGLTALFDAADRVARGEADAEWFSTGPEPRPDDEPIAREAVSDEDDEEEDGLDDVASAFVTAVAAVRAARGDVPRVAETLDAARLTRGFLLELAERAECEPAGKTFAEALARQSGARERMILCNLRLALSIAKKYLRSGLPLDDLVQEANIGLMKAVERFDWRRGFRFSTYATWWIRQQVSRSVADKAKIVRAPVHIQETAWKVIREREEVEARLGRSETEMETARRIGMSIAKTRLLLSVFNDAESLDELDLETGLSRADLLPDPDATDPADLAERASLRSTLLGMLDELDERAREVIFLRFGLGGEDVMTLEEVGQRFGVTRERIRQIESKTMRWLSHRNRQAILAPFMGAAYTPRRSAETVAPAGAPSSEVVEPAASDETVDVAPAPPPPSARPAPISPAVERDVLAK